MQSVGSVNRYPARALAIWYLGLIALGTAALCYPGCRSEQAAPISVLDALFTATSASCVTGLVVLSTGHDLSWLGQAVVLLLIQIGGVGIMTLTTYVMFTIGRPASLRHRAVLSTTIGADATQNLNWLLRYVLLSTLLAELIGFVILAFNNLVAGLPFGYALWHALFHSVSAFCNAGFALQDDSLVPYQRNLVVNLTVIGLIVTGGIGFPVLLDLKEKWTGDWRKWDAWRQSWERMSLHTKLMLIGTVLLIGFGLLAFLILEWTNTLADMPYWQRIMVALFHSVTCRTAGFNSVDVPSLTNAMLFISILLMMIGAGPGSTAGGFKVSTLAILVIRAWSAFRGHEKASVFRRTIPSPTVTKAMVTAVLFAAVAMAALTIVLAFEQSIDPHLKSRGAFLDCAFEVISALGTVGLSTGLTDDLTTPGRVIIIILMFFGRLGPITVFTALSRGQRRDLIEFSSEEPLIG